MPVRKTKRGAERTALEGSYDVVICGASFAGLTIARELTGSGARVLVLDRYEIGERQTSACAAPTEWLEALGLMTSVRQTFDDLVFHTPHVDTRMRLPWSFSTFDYPELCGLLWAGADAEFETAKVEGRGRLRRLGPAVNGSPRPIAVETDRGIVEAPLVVDALGWRRVLGDGYQPPDAPLSRGLEVHPGGTRRGPRALDRARRRSRRLRLELPGRRRAPGRRRQLRPRATTSRTRPSSWPSASTCRPTATRATGSPTSSATRSTATSSSAATPPATACR